jgi:membrane-bound metal-dependent hydrolase YbcI (DUF457 family)
VGFVLGATGAMMLAPGGIGDAFTSITESSAFFAGAVVGGRAPDKLELATWSKLTDRRYSLIPHRTLTHWPVPWVALLAYSMYLIHDATDLTTAAIAWAITGFALSGGLHLVLDIMTPTGIPLLHPFGTKTSFTIYRSGSPVEVLLVAAIVVIGLTALQFI